MKITSKVLALTVCLLLVTAPYALAQDICVGDFDYDRDCDGTDAARFKQDFGRSIFENPCPLPSPAPALVPKTGQTTSYATGDDGDLGKGVPWPNPRFTDNLDGTVTDNLTGLIWLKNANCFGQRTWNNALSDSNGLASGSCGLTDGSSAGDWRLPNRRELFSLAHDDYYSPAVPNTAGTGQWTEGDPFNDVQSNNYWSSSTFAPNTDNAWSVGMLRGYVYYYSNSFSFYVWPVRGGQ